MEGCCSGMVSRLIYYLLYASKYVSIDVHTNGLSSSQRQADRNLFNFLPFLRQVVNIIGCLILLEILDPPPVLLRWYNGVSVSSLFIETLPGSISGPRDGRVHHIRLFFATESRSNVSGSVVYDDHWKLVCEVILLLQRQLILCVL